MLPFTHLLEPSLTPRLFTPEKNIFLDTSVAILPQQVQIPSQVFHEKVSSLVKTLIFKGYHLPPRLNPIPGYVLGNSLPRRYTWRYTQDKGGPVES